MGDDPEFRDDVRSIVRHHDPSPDELRALATDLETLADKWDTAEDVL